MEKHCSNCGTISQTEKSFCPECGTSFEQKVTHLDFTVWTKKKVIAVSDSSPLALLELIATAINSKGYPLTSYEATAGKLVYESGGPTAWSWMGEVTSVSVSKSPEGSKAEFVSKTVKHPIFQFQLSANTRKWVDRIKPHLKY